MARGADAQPIAASLRLLHGDSLEQRERRLPHRLKLLCKRAFFRIRSEVLPAQRSCQLLQTFILERPLTRQSLLAFLSLRVTDNIGIESTLPAARTEAPVQI